MIPRIFEGQSVAIVAGGPSLRGFDFDQLRGHNVIAVNRSLEVLPSAQVLWWSDAMFWRKHRDRIMAHAAPFKATCQMNYHTEDALDPAIHEYRFNGLQGFDPDPQCLRHGNNSTYAAMHLAAHLGAAKLVLFGVDMKHGADGATHWHNGHGLLHRDETLKDVMLPYFASLKKPLEHLQIEVLNASADSALTVWPRCSIEAGLYELSQRPI